MAEQALLSDLCSICYTEKPKYRCPRCRTQTCSMACYKKHQQRASCSGKRDPASYLKKSQWATPTGLDQDYNYLKDVERTIDHASQDVRDRGIGFYQSAPRNVARGWRENSVLQKYLTENRITVERAPRGMTRQKTNQTRPTKSNRVVWTVEWVDGHGVRETQHDCGGSDSVASLYAAFQAEKRNAKAVATSSERSRQKPKNSKKRKRRDVKDDASEPIAESAMPAGTGSKEGPDTKGEDSIPIDDAETGADSSPNFDLPSGSSEVPADPPARSPQPHDGKPQHILTGQLNGEEPDASQTTASGFAAQQDDEDEVEIITEHHFYLLKPATASADRVLVPLTPDATLTESLRDQTVQEYPTFYVLPRAPKALPEGFVLDVDYAQARQKEDAELKSLQQEVSKDGVMHAGSRQQMSEESTLDSNAILEMLKRDVRV